MIFLRARLLHECTHSTVEKLQGATEVVVGSRCREIELRFTPDEVDTPFMPANIFTAPRVAKLMPTPVALSCTSKSSRTTPVGTQLAVCLEHTYKVAGVGGFLVLPKANSPPQPSARRVIAPTVAKEAVGLTSGAQQRTPPQWCPPCRPDVHLFARCRL